MAFHGQPLCGGSAKPRRSSRASLVRPQLVFNLPKKSQHDSARWTDVRSQTCTIFDAFQPRITVLVSVSWPRKLCASVSTGGCGAPGGSSIEGVVGIDVVEMVDFGQMVVGRWQEVPEIELFRQADARRELPNHPYIPCDVDPVALELPVMFHCRVPMLSRPRKFSLNAATSCWPL